MMRQPTAPTTEFTAAAPANPTPDPARAGGLVTSAITSRLSANGSGRASDLRKSRGRRVHAKRVYPSALPLAPKVGSNIGRGFPGVELLRHVRDEFGPD